MKVKYLIILNYCYIGEFFIKKNMIIMIDLFIEFVERILKCYLLVKCFGLIRISGGCVYNVIDFIVVNMIWSVM